MANTQWTQEQLDAIESRGSNLLVAAAAGSGKTAVLVERIIRRLTEPEPSGDFIDVDNLLVVTFTNAAAAEMRQRITDALVKKLAEVCSSSKADNKLVIHLNRQIALIGSANITTLHSFCLEIVRRYFYRLDLDPTFRIAAENEIALLKLEVLEELFEELYSMKDGNEVFLQLVDAYGGARGDEELFQILLKLHNFARTMPWPQEWLKAVVNAYYIEDEKALNEQQWIQNLLKVISFEIKGALEKLKQASIITNLPGGPAVYRQNIEKDLEMVEDLAREASWSALAAKITESQLFPSLKACRDKDVDEGLKEQAKNLRNDAKKIIQDIHKNYFVTPVQEVIADLTELAPYIEALTELTGKFESAFALAKQEKAIVDFNDLEHFCLRILLAEASTYDKETPSEVALALQEQFAEVLVDEYQDINPLQEIILKLVSRQGSEQPNMFMVGDVKQSIYRFRLTEPELFLNKYHTYPTCKGGEEYRIDLAANFRSRKSVLNGVNFVFRQIMSEGVGEINYDKKAELLSGASYEDTENTPSPAVEVHIIDRKKEDAALENIQEESEEEELDASKLEARLLVRRVLQLVESPSGNTNGEFQVFDKHLNACRALTYRDIVILLRATKGWANTLLEEFRAVGIPAYAELGSGYFEAIEIETMLALLQVIDNPRQDIYLTAVLRSPIVGLDASALSIIRLSDMRGDFYDAVKAAAEVVEGDAQENFALKLKLNTFLDRLESWRTAARQQPLTELIWQIYRETGYYDYVGGMPGGSQRQANLRALLDRALEYETTNLRGLFRFLRFIERVRDKGNDLGAARSLGENENVVRIMSIHKSKGLEFPVVIVAGMGKGFNFMDVNNKYLLHKKEGLGIDAVDLKLRITYPTLFKKALQQKIKLETLAEEMRLLYVAMTRAKEKLILVGSLRDFSKDMEKWARSLTVKGWQLPDFELAKSTCYMHWLGSALIRHSGASALRSTQNKVEYIDEEISTDPSSWEIQVYPRAEVAHVEKMQDISDELLEKVKQLEPVAIQGAEYERICQWLSWEYPYKAVVSRPAKVTVTEIKRRFDPLQEEDEQQPTFRPAFARPLFMQKSKGLTAAERGSAMHLAMQNIDLDVTTDIKSIDMQLEKILNKELFTLEQFKAIDSERLAEFFSSEIGKRMLACKETVKRELPFTLALPVKEVYTDLADKVSDEEKVLVQGVIDCLYEEADGFILVDYKTDWVKAGQEEDIISRYRGQLNLYAFAVEQILKKPVREKWIYLFSIGKCMQVT